MNEIEIFYLLKEKVLATYKITFPFYSGSIHDFGNKEIAQFQDNVEDKINERISEKWVYTHLKPKSNDKLPRKDMLDILSKYTGFESWEEFLFKNSNQENKQTSKTDISIQKSKKTTYFMTAGIAIATIGMFLGIQNFTENKPKTICFKDKYTQKNIENGKIEVFELKENKKEKIHLKNNCLQFNAKKQTVIVVESPYYKTDTLILNSETKNFEIDLMPDDYAMMLRAYMNSNLEDWNKRKAQLDAIIDENAEIEEVMFEEIGVEFLNKTEFIDKITTPSETVRKMEIVEIKYENDKIISLKFIQKKS
jgi:hypothetical protein